MTRLILHVGCIPRIRLILAVTAAFALSGGFGRPSAQAVSNPIVLENALPGTTDNWDINGAGDPTIQGFATDISVNTGQTASFKIKTDSSNYKIEIYRLGYDGGAGARNIATLGTFTQPQNQTATCATDPTTGLVDCGTWAVFPTSWTVPATAVSGIYIAKLTRFDGTGGSSHIVFIVRDDARQADIVVQTSDTTWQAYNRYGGGSLYCGGPISNAGSVYATECATRSAKVSYDRPFDTRGHDARSFLFGAEYPMVRWLEANGYDVKYWAGIDTDRRGAALTGALKPKAFLSVGHDEYWSGNQRIQVENARNNGVGLAFFSGNEMYWKTRYESSIDGSNIPYRTLVSYKETLASAKIDPAVDSAGHPIWTGTWRDPRFSPPADGGRPENGVTGTIWTVNSGSSAITVPAAMSHFRFWRSTRVADLAAGVAVLSAESLGYEWDEDLDNGARPAGLVHLSSTTVNGVDRIIDFGATTAIGSATHSLTLYRHTSGALVFGAGTVQWAWGLDGIHDGGTSLGAHVPDQAMQQSTVNLLADMGARAGSLQIGADPSKPLIASGASTDIVAPTSVVTSPAVGAHVQSGGRVTISGTATDSGGSVAGVEVSVDGGTTWRLAQSAADWRLDWSPGALGPVSIRSRAIDDSGNVEVPGAGVTVSVVTRCPCTTLWDAAADIPARPDVDDVNPVEVGIRFFSDHSGFITGLRFYKSANNTGAHIGNLWTSTGTPLSSATFTNETASGWQEVLFNEPVAITAHTTYVASYHTSAGHYAASSAYFASAGIDSIPLHAPPAGTSGNGVYQYGSGGFPTDTFNANNYWVDVVFSEPIVNSAPVASDGTLTTDEDTPAGGTLSASDVDLNPLTYSVVANGLKGTAIITGVATGAFSYLPNANANGTDTFTFKVNDGTSDSNVATETVTIASVNDAPSFIKGADQPVIMNSGAHAVAGWATALSPGPANETAETLSFLVSNTNAALFSAQPAIASNGTLTYTSAVNAVGSATVTVSIRDSGGTANGGVDTSASQTFSITVATPLGGPPLVGPCDITYTGTSKGDLTVSNGQTVCITSGTVTGNVTVNGGSLAVFNTSTITGNLQIHGGNLVLANTTVNGNLAINGRTSFSIGVSAAIHGNLQIQNVPAGTGQNQICGANINGNLQFNSNGVAVQIGSDSAPCLGNAIGGDLQVTNNSAAASVYDNAVGGNLQVQNDTASTQVFSNSVTKSLQCTSNSSITGGGNTAAQKQGQCAGF